MYSNRTLASRKLEFQKYRFVDEVSRNDTGLLAHSVCTNANGRVPTYEDARKKINTRQGCVGLPRCSSSATDRATNFHDAIDAIFQ